MKRYGMLLREISRRILLMLFCAMLLGGCSAPKTEDTTAEGESTAVPQKSDRIVKIQCGALAPCRWKPYRNE